jgi:protease-4
VIADTYAWFKRLVADRRRLGEPELAAVSTGQIFSGRQGVGLKLIDEIGGEREAVAWLEREKGVAKNLPVRTWRPRRDGNRLDLWTAGAFGADLVGLDGLATRLRQASLGAEASALSGLLAVWHPSLDR